MSLDQFIQKNFRCVARPACVVHVPRGYHTADDVDFKWRRSALRDTVHVDEVVNVISWRCVDERTETFFSSALASSESLPVGNWYTRLGIRAEFRYLWSDLRAERVTFYQLLAHVEYTLDDAAVSNALSSACRIFFEIFMHEASPSGFDLPKAPFPTEMRVPWDLVGDEYTNSYWFGGSHTLWRRLWGYVEGQLLEFKGRTVIKTQRILFLANKLCSNPYRQLSLVAKTAIRMPAQIYIQTDMKLLHPLIRLMCTTKLQRVGVPFPEKYKAGLLVAAGVDVDEYLRFVKEANGCWSTASQAIPAPRKEPVPTIPLIAPEYRGGY